MKNFICFCIFSLLIFTAVAQEGVKVKGNTISMKDIAPVWPGCETSKETPQNCFNTQLNTLIKKNFKYPKDAKGNIVRGQTVIAFTIDEKGKVKNIKATGDHKALNDEAMRIVGLFPQMKPGMRGGKAVPISLKMPFNF